MISQALAITKTPSPNFDTRTLPISLIVLHYTGMDSALSALERMRDPSAKVSAHYMIDEAGKIFHLVDEDNRAWHAGVSSWHGETNINSASIGIEIVNGGHDYGLPPFPDVQIMAVIALTKDIMKRRNIAAMNVIGHSDIAPQRKLDPGEKFPWSGLGAAGIGVWPQAVDPDTRELFAPNARGRGVSIAQSGLAHLGYCAQVTGELDPLTVSILKALQRRYRPDLINGHIDVQTLGIIKSLCELKAALELNT